MIKHHFISIFFLLQIISSAQGQDLKLWYQQPSEKWMGALPLGNGRLGAMIYGGTETETIALNEVSLWSGQPDDKQEIPCGKEKLAEIRKLFFEGKIIEGNELATQYLSGQPHSFGTHLPMGNLKLKFNYENKNISSYQRELNISEAISSVSFQAGNVKYRREYFCSNPEDVFLMKFTADKKAALTFDISLDLLRDASIKASGNELVFSGKVNFPKQGPGGVRFQGIIKVSLKGGTVVAGNNALKISKADEAVIVLDMRTDFHNPTYQQLCSQTIQMAASKKYDDIKNTHIQDYKKLFDRTALFLGETPASKLPTDVRRLQLKEGKEDPGLFALFFQYGRYLLIASSRENSPLPANLQGIWNDNLACNMPWTCDYHLDINTEQNYWLSNVGNLHECNTPLFNYIENLSIDGEKTAKKVYGSPGWVAHTVANVWGYTAPGQGVTWGLFPTASAWIATHLWEQYLYTQDIGFLKNKAYPILKKTAVFFQDYMVENPDNGYLMSGPSISPENSFLFNNKDLAVSMMPTCDKVFITEIYNACIQSAKILNVDRDFSNSLKKSLEKFPPFKIGKNGALQEWFDDFDEAHPNHRHTTHLLALYPYNQITLQNTPDLARASEITVENRLKAEGWEDTEWSRANMICLYARLKDSGKAYESLKTLFTKLMRENMFTVSPGGIAMAEEDIFSFDANEAGAAGIAEMLIQNHEGYIEFLPVLPEQWNSGYFKGICVKGGGVAGLSWKDGKVVKAALKATCDNMFKIKIPGRSNIQYFVNGKKTIFPSDPDHMITVSLKKGDFWELK